MRIIKELTKAVKQTRYLKETVVNAPKVFFCHVPKCGGTAAVNAIRPKTFLGYRRGIFDINLEASLRASQVFSEDLMRVREIVLSYNLSNPQNYFGIGHVYCRPDLVKSFMDDWNFITLLRNPVDRWISEYVYNTYKKIKWTKNEMQLDEYLTSEKGRITGTSFIRYFSTMPIDYSGNTDVYVDEAIENLGCFSVVGTIERLQEWRESYRKKFNINISIPRSNTSPKVEAADEIRSSDYAMREINKLCELDLRIYRKMIEQDGGAC